MTVLRKETITFVWIFNVKLAKKQNFFPKKSYLSLRDRSTCSDLQFVLKSEHLNSLYLEPGNLHLHFFGQP